MLSSSPSVTHKIDWLFDEQLPSTLWSGSLQRVSYPYPPDLAIGYAEQIEFHDGISMVKVFHNFTNEDRPEEIPLGNFFVQPAVPSFTSHIMHTGSLNFINNKNNDKLVRTSGVDLFSRIETIDITQILLTDEDISLTAIFIPEAQLINLLGLHEVEFFYKNLGISNLGDYNQIKIPQTISNKIANCTPSHLSGNLRQLFANSVILQYLIEVNIYIASMNSFKKNSLNSKFDITGLHTELLQVTGDIPKLNDIAKKYNVTPYKLNQVFLENYNQSIYNFLANQRLDQAYQGLLETDIPMKTLAHKIGYSHVNHFITAFKNKFGITPGSIRRQAR
jgi:AraC-like DNA-binding protein